MDFARNADDLAFIISKAAEYNFDNLVMLFTRDTDYKTMRQHLQTLYYEVVEYIGREDVFPLLVDSLYHLQLIIQAVESMGDINERHLEIKAV